MTCYCLQTGVFKLSGPGKTTATKISTDEDLGNCMVVTPLMQHCEGKERGRRVHTISFRMASDAGKEVCAFHGVVRAGTSCYAEPVNLLGQIYFDFDEIDDGDNPVDNTNEGWFMDSLGSLFGRSANGRAADGDEEGDGNGNDVGNGYSDGAGEIMAGQILTMQLDLDVGSLQFWVDGKRHGAGFESGVTNDNGGLCWAVTLGMSGASSQIVANPELTE